MVDPVSRRSEFDRLKDVAKAASRGKFKERLALLAGIAVRLSRREAWQIGLGIALLAAAWLNSAWGRAALRGQ